MLYRKTTFLVGMALTAAMLMITATASAQPTEVTVSGGQTSVDVAPGRVWFTGVILHVRGRIISVTLTGDIAGTATQILDFNINTVTSEGDLRGSVEFTGTLVGVGAGELRGTFAGDISAGVFSVESFGHGTFGGNVAHSRVTTTGVFGSAIATYDGTVRFPNGE